MQSQRMLAWLPRRVFDESLSRRRFLQGLGLLAGAGAMAPLIKTFAGHEATRVDVTRPRLGTWVRVVARHRDPARASAAMEAAFAAFDQVDRTMSIHRLDSDLSRVNRAAGHAAVAVPAALIEVVDRARDAARRTEGLYDPTGLPLFRVYGFYGPTRTSWPSDREIGDALERVGFRGIALDRAAGTLGLARAGAALDLGSIGKGWAVDRAASAMRDVGIADGLVDAGGNIYAFGAPEDGAPGWSVGVLDPRTRGVSRVFVLRDAAISTSGNYEQFHTLGGRKVGHLFDALRGRPADGLLSATVLAADAARADVLSTVAFLLGPDRFHWPEARDLHWIA